MLAVPKRLRRAWSLSGRRGLSRGPQASGIGAQPVAERGTHVRGAPTFVLPK